MQRSTTGQRPLRYKVEGYAQTRDALVWVGSSGPDLAFGLTLDDALAALEHGYDSVRSELAEPARVAQLDHSRAQMRVAIALFQQGRVHEAKVTMQNAEELFITLRRVRGKAVSRQQLGETEHGGNEVDE